MITRNLFLKKSYSKKCTAAACQKFVHYMPTKYLGFIDVFATVFFELIPICGMEAASSEAADGKRQSPAAWIRHGTLDLNNLN